MRICLALVMLACCLVAEAHIGSPNVFLEGKAGEYSVRVVIRPPDVVPGLAEITVRVQEPVERITVFPVFWHAGREGAPPPDEAMPVRSEAGLYSAQLWLMKPGAYSVDVNIEGPRGKGALVVPVNSVATNTRPMQRSYGLILSGLAAVLFLSGLKIAGAIFGESHLAPGAQPVRRDWWRGVAAMAATAVVLVLLMAAGKKWWDLEDRDYRNNILYQPQLVSARVRIEREQPILTIQVDIAQRRGRWTPLIPDHGKLMHLFLVRDSAPGAFAHLHPVLRSEGKFEVPLPPLPAGKYHVYADVTHENGFAETLVATAEIPAVSAAMRNIWLGESGDPVCSSAVAQMLATKLAFPPDADDSWHLDKVLAVSSSAGKNLSSVASQVTEVGGGYKMVWDNPDALAGNMESSLRFRLVAPDNQPASIEPYMDMLGHAVVRLEDGTVFAHVHPVGTFSMAAQQFFVEGQPPKPPNPAARLVSHTSHTNQVGAVGEISFPYAFPKPGSYRFWVQMKTQGRILTGAFDTTVAEGK